MVLKCLQRRESCGQDVPLGPLHLKPSHQPPHMSARGGASCFSSGRRGQSWHRLGTGSVTRLQPQGPPGSPLPPAPAAPSPARCEDTPGQPAGRSHISVTECRACLLRVPNKHQPVTGRIGAALLPHPRVFPLFQGEREGEGERDTHVRETRGLVAPTHTLTKA